jgi:hypothetical protein
VGHVRVTQPTFTTSSFRNQRTMFRLSVSVAQLIFISSHHKKLPLSSALLNRGGSPIQNKQLLLLQRLFRNMKSTTNWRSREICWFDTENRRLIYYCVW